MMKFGAFIPFEYLALFWHYFWVNLALSACENLATLDYAHHSKPLAQALLNYFFQIQLTVRKLQNALLVVVLSTMRHLDRILVF